VHCMQRLSSFAALEKYNLEGSRDEGLGTRYARQRQAFCGNDVTIYVSRQQPARESFRT
jgi:hypothetical protein